VKTPTISHNAILAMLLLALSHCDGNDASSFDRDIATGIDGGNSEKSDAGLDMTACTDPNLPDFCNGACVRLASDRTHCGTCGTICADTDDCIGTCRPKNDRMAGAYDLEQISHALSNVGETIMSGPLFTTAGAAPPDDPVVIPVACGGKGGSPSTLDDIDVWYKFTLYQTEVVYVDTLEASDIDTKLYFTDVNGIPNSAAPGNYCGDNSPCGGMGAQIAQQLDGSPAGKMYYVVVTSTSPGAFTLRFQHLPYVAGKSYTATLGPLTSYPYLSERKLSADAPKRQPSCVKAGEPSRHGEDAYWFTSCGNQPITIGLCHSLLGGNGGSFTYVTKNSFGSINHHNPVIDVISGSTGEESQCNDNYDYHFDTSGNDVSVCANPDGGSSYAAARKDVSLSRGLHIVTIGDLQAPTPVMSYNLAYDIH
jgi:hypothetical protein